MTASTPKPPAAFKATGATAPKLTAAQALEAEVKEKGLTAALDSIVQADVFDPTTVPAFVGELWKGRRYTQRYAPLISHSTVTGMKMTGWRWVNTPTVADYAGNLAEVPTNEVTAEAVEFGAQRVASGHKVDRIHFDLNNGGFINSFLQERADNYARVMDGKVLAHLTTAANSTALAVPAATTDPWEKLILGAQKLLEYATPDYAIVGADIYPQMAMLTDQDKLAFFNSSLGLEEGSVAGFRVVGAPATDTALNGKIIVGARAATTLYELPGGPIRVEAADVAHGGVDMGLFGYYSLFTSDARGVVTVTNAAA